MSWGHGGWGISEWGGGETPSPAGTLVVSSPAAVDVIGGDVITIAGTGFTSPMLVEFLQGGTVIGASTSPSSPYIDTIAAGVARGTIVNPTYDITSTLAYVGTPALPAGTYDMRMTTEFGTSTLLVGALVSKPVAHEHRVLAMRSKWARAWQVGPRLFSGG